MHKEALANKNGQGFIFSGLFNRQTSGHSLFLFPDFGPQVHTAGQLYVSVHSALPLLSLASHLSWLFYVVLFEYCLFSFTLSPTSSVGRVFNGFYVYPQICTQLRA